MLLDLMEKKKAFSDPSGRFGNNAILFGVDLSSSVHVENKKNIFSLLVKVLHKD